MTVIRHKSCLVCLRQDRWSHQTWKLSYYTRRHDRWSLHTQTLSSVYYETWQMESLDMKAVLCIHTRGMTLLTDGVIRHESCLVIHTGKHDRWSHQTWKLSCVYILGDMTNGFIRHEPCLVSTTRLDRWSHWTWKMSGVYLQKIHDRQSPDMKDA